MNIINVRIFLGFELISYALLQYALAQNCDYYQELVNGIQYSIYNPGYPNKYNSPIRCRWIMRAAAGSNVFISCNTELPQSQNCGADKLLISLSGNSQLDDARVYCGNRSFSLYSQQTDLSVGLYAPFNGQGGRFLCTVTAIKRPGNNLTSQISTCDCGWTQMHRIIGGVETGLHEFPFMVGIIYNNNLLCGGVIISDRFVLSAAHCVLNKNAYDLKLLMGDHDISAASDTRAIYEVNAWRIHPDYNPKIQTNDISLLQSSTQIYFSPSIGPVCLPFRYSYQSFNGQPVLILGWGQLEFNGPQSNTLQKAEVKIVSNEECRSQQSENVIDEEICTYSTEIRDACLSDSGGPVIWFDTGSRRYQIIGIISHGVPCGTDAPAINTRVTEYLQWIIDTTNSIYCIK